MTESNLLYDEESAATYIGGPNSPISTRTMQRWRLEGVGPSFIKLGRMVRYRKSDLDVFIEAHVYTSTSAAAANAPGPRDRSARSEICHD